MNTLEMRCLQEADIMINGKMTLRQVAKIVGMSKSTVHKDLTERLPKFDTEETDEKYVEVMKIISKNKAERHIRGGIATKEKYKKLKQ